MKIKLRKKILIFILVTLFIGTSVGQIIGGDTSELKISSDIQKVNNEKIDRELYKEISVKPDIVFVKDELRCSLIVVSAKSDCDWSQICYWDGLSWSSIPEHPDGKIFAGDRIYCTQNSISLQWMPTASLLGSTNGYSKFLEISS